MKIAIRYFLVWMLFYGGVAHPVHISVTEVTFDEKENELEIVMRIFTNDLEPAIRKARQQPELKILEPVGVTTDKLVEQYLDSRFKIWLDGRPQKVKYLGHEIEDEVMLCYVQVRDVKKWNAFEVKNSIITELYDDQSNLINVTVRGQVKSLRLMRENQSGKLTFD